MDLYALFLGSWSRPQDDLKKIFEPQTLATAEILSSIVGPIGLLTFEFSSSNFDSATLSHVRDLCVIINENLSQLLSYSAALPNNLKARFMRFSGALDHKMTGDIMAVLTLVEQSLISNDPLPALLPVPLTSRCIELNSRVTALTEGQDTLNVDMIQEEGFRKYCVVLSAFMHLLGAADELVMLVKSAVGESHIVDVEGGISDARTISWGASRM
jgi:Aromatic acid exporter family member 2